MAQSFKESYSSKKIYLSLSLAKQLDEIDKLMLRLWNDFLNNHPRLNQSGNLDINKWDASWEAFSGKEIPAMLRKLEEEFRSSLGSDLD